MANTLELIAKKLGLRVNYRVNPETATVGTEATKVLGNNPGRLAVVICNLGTVDVKLAPSPAVSSSYGISLPASGSFSLEWQEDYLLPILEWYAIASQECSVFVLEIFAAGEG